MTIVRKHKRRTKRKVATVRRHKRKSKITKRQRKLFTAMGTLPDEVGGQLDLERGKLQNVRTHFGTHSELVFPWDPDYEVGYHTHPGGKESSIMPSYDDIISMRLTNQREDLIIRKNLILAVAEKDMFRKVPIKKIRNISNAMGRDLHKGMSDKKLYNKYKPIFKKELGLVMRWHNPDKPIILESEAV